jgi:glycosyltransferase involved in cell wall biosynthesis
MGVGPIPEISVVVPVYNEEENVELLYQKLVSALDQLGPYMGSNPY